MKSLFWERDWIFGRIQTITFERGCGSFNIPYCICCSSVSVASPILHLCLSPLSSFVTLFYLFIFCSSPPATRTSHLCSSSCTNGEVTIIHVIVDGPWTGVSLALLLILHCTLKVLDGKCTGVTDSKKMLAFKSPFDYCPLTPSL